MRIDSAKPRIQWTCFEEEEEERKNLPKFGIATSRDIVAQFPNSEVLISTELRLISLCP